MTSHPESPQLVRTALKNLSHANELHKAASIAGLPKTSGRTTIRDLDGPPCGGGRLASDGVGGSCYGLGAGRLPFERRPELRNPHQ